VVEHHRHTITEPHLSLTTEFADCLFQSRRQKAALEVAARVGRMLDENSLQRNATRGCCSRHSDMRVEVVRRDIPSLGPSLDRAVVVALDSVPQETQHVEPTLGLVDRCAEVLF
jgi:hypothetical protein